MKKIILASASPRRKEILANLGLDFTIAPANIDETPMAEEEPQSYVLRMAVQKAIAAAKAHGEKEGIFLAADTIVVLDNKILGKPENVADAKSMLSSLSGREHIVITAIGMVDKGNNRTVSAMEQTVVYFQELNQREIESYVATGEPMDKAGGYGAQGLGSLFIRRLEGDYFNVVGLPVNKLYTLFKEIGIDLLG
ncbi:MAG: nucleoside triphosphate pyrophosphatase [Clostridiales bacterium]